jgi:acyl carrier protein
VEIKDKIRQFLTTNFYVPNAAALSDSQSLLDAGIVDSTGVLEVIAFLETEFGIEVSNNEMVPENLDAVDNIVGYVARKLGK